MPMLQKLNELGYEVCLICHIHLTSRQLPTTSSGMSTTFCRENASTASRRHVILSKSWLNPEATIFMLKGKKIIDKSVLIVVVLILINKDVLEPGYDDLNSQSERAITFLPT